MPVNLEKNFLYVNKSHFSKITSDENGTSTYNNTTAVEKRYKEITWKVGSLNLHHAIRISILIFKKSVTFLS